MLFVCHLGERLLCLSSQLRPDGRRDDEAPASLAARASVATRRIGREQEGKRGGNRARAAGSAAAISDLSLTLSLWIGLDWGLGKCGATVTEDMDGVEDCMDLSQIRNDGSFNSKRLETKIQRRKPQNSC